MSSPTNRPASAFEQTDGSAPRMDVRKSNPQLSRVIEKLVAPNRSAVQQRRENRKISSPDMNLYRKISDETVANVNSSASMVQLLPDLELAMQILISSILSPKDMVSTELTFTVDQGSFTSEVSGLMLDRVRDYFVNTYKISDDLTTILENILFYKGAHILAVLPENSIDDIINNSERVTLESISTFYDKNAKTIRPLGILGLPKGEEGKTTTATGLESMFEQVVTNSRTYTPGITAKGVDLGVSVVDNPAILKMPKVAERVRKDLINDRLNAGNIRRRSTLESRDDGKNDSLYRVRRYKNTAALAVVPGSQLKRQTEGRPLVMNLPTEAVIPVHIPSSPEEHLGYFVLLDEMGNPLVRSNEQDYYNDLTVGIQQNKQMVDQLISRTDRNTNGIGSMVGSERQQEIDELSRIYGDIVEEELYSRLKNGVYGDNVAVSRPSEVYRIMLARSLQQQRTQLLYIPAEMVSYMAFSFNKYGVGESLLQGSKIVGSIRAMLLFANTMAAIKNSVGRTKLAIQLDPQDPDPSTTVEFLINEYARATQNSYPLGVTAPRDLIHHLQNASVEVEVSGNTAYPETKMEIQDTQSNRIKPDAEFETSMRDRHLMSLGLSPEVVDAGTKAEFATSVLANNLLLAKRVMNYQKKLTLALQEFVQMYILNDGSMMDELRKVIEENIEKLTDEHKETIKRVEDKVRKTDSNRRPEEDTRTSHQRDRDEILKVTTEESLDALVIEFVQAIRLSLPSPDVGSLENQMIAFDKYVEALDKALAAYLNPDFLEATQIGELQEVIAPTIAAVRAHYIRQWLRNNNVLPELDDLVTFGDDEGPAVDLLKIHGTHIEGISKSIADFMKELAKSRRKTDETYNETKNDPEEAADGTDGEGGEEADTTGDDTGGGDLPDDDMGDLDDIGAPPDADAGDAAEDTAPDADAEEATADETESEAAEPDAGTPDEGDKAAEPKEEKEEDKNSNESIQEPPTRLNMFTGRFPPPFGRES